MYDIKASGGLSDLLIRASLWTPLRKL